MKKCILLGLLLMVGGAFASEQEDMNLELMRIQKMLFDGQLEFMNIHDADISTAVRTMDTNPQQALMALGEKIGIYMDANLVSLLQKVAREFGITSAEQAEAFVNRYLPVLEQSLPMKIQEWVLVYVKSGLHKKGNARTPIRSKQPRRRR